MSNKIMSPHNPRWDEFASRLEGEEGCDFKQKIEGDPTSVTWKCGGGNDKSFAKAILEKMGGIDIEETLKYFDRNGGYCDCEILFNIDRG